MTVNIYDEYLVQSGTTTKTWFCFLSNQNAIWHFAELSWALIFNSALLKIEQSQNPVKRIPRICPTTFHIFYLSKVLGFLHFYQDVNTHNTHKHYRITQRPRKIIFDNSKNIISSLLNCKWKLLFYCVQAFHWPWSIHREYFCLNLKRRINKKEYVLIEAWKKPADH